MRPDDVAEIVAKWTGIPVTRLLESEREKLLRLSEQLHEAGGGTRRSTPCRCAVLRARAELSDRVPRVPSSSWSPGGVGKTEPLKALAEKRPALT